jgi:branched-subunit amino acid ABC-type transport system permease component
MQRIIGAVLGALATYLLLVVLVGGVSTQTFLIAVGIGLIVTIVWPWAVELMVARRAAARRKAAIDREVQDQLVQKSGGG